MILMSRVLKSGHLWNSEFPDLQMAEDYARGRFADNMENQPERIHLYTTDELGRLSYLKTV
jgi:hypothetical protein